MKNFDFISIKDIIILKLGFSLILCKNLRILDNYNRYVKNL